MIDNLLGGSFGGNYNKVQGMQITNKNQANSFVFGDQVA